MYDTNPIIDVAIVACCITVPTLLTLAAFEVTAWVVRKIKGASQ